MYRIESIIEFPYYIPIKKEVLGLEYKVVISSQECILSFPCIPDDYLNNFEKIPFNHKLNPPVNADIKLFPYEKNNWGEYHDIKGNSFVKKCSIWFFHESLDLDLGSDIAEQANDYIKRLILFLELLSKQALDIKSLIISMRDNISFITRDNKGKTILASNNMGYAHVYIYDESIFISKKNIEKAILLTNRNFTPHVPYLFLKDAYHHISSHEYRKSILDASTAIEIALTTKIQDKLIESGVNHGKLLSSILKKYHSLSGRIELSNILEIPLPVNKKEYDFIATVRNRAIHAGYLSNYNEAKKLIDIANQTIEHFFVLI